MMIFWFFTIGMIFADIKKEREFCREKIIRVTKRK
jgi:hypothetical protein